jgi:hypothetical protein
VEAALDIGIVHWDRVRAGEALDPVRFLGRRSDLPPYARPGEWCTLVLGEHSWTLIAAEPGRKTHPQEQLHPTASRRRAAASAGRRGAPLGDALARVPQPAASASPSGSGLTAQADPLARGESGEGEPATGSFRRGR